MDPALKERIHFSLMFYGGRLLSHLSVDDKEVSDFISLVRINRHPAILVDSDKRKPKTELNATKKRIVSEFEKIGALAWVTDGREVENYVSPETVKLCVGKIAPGRESDVKAGRWSAVLPKHVNKNGDETSKSVDKVAVAKAVAATAPNLSVLGLRDRVVALARYIRKANHMAALD